MATRHSSSAVKRFVFDNGLSLLMFGLFLVFLAGLSITGYLQNNQELAAHHQAAQPYLSYLGSGEFIEAVFENWESEFLQMATLVVATVFLRQRGSVDSKHLHGRMAVDTSSRYSIIRATSWANRRKAVGSLLYGNSLSLALLTLFLLSFILHAVGGVESYNDDARLHGEPSESLLGYVTGVQFWFESFQNWQSEFLSVGTLLVLSIFLRQRGSPESKAVGDPHGKTGES